MSGGLGATRTGGEDTQAVSHGPGREAQAPVEVVALGYDRMDAGNLHEVHSVPLQ